MSPPPSPIENPRKLKEKLHKNYPRWEEVTTGTNKKTNREPPRYNVFLQRWYLDPIRLDVDLFSRPKTFFAV
jgi:hypothetical protein